MKIKLSLVKVLLCIIDHFRVRSRERGKPQLPDTPISPMALGPGSFLGALRGGREWMGRVTHKHRSDGTMTQSHRLLRVAEGMGLQASSTRLVGRGPVMLDTDWLIPYWHTSRSLTHAPTHPRTARTSHPPRSVTFLTLSHS